ncbi:hypothetical protein EUTSA_v10018468mg [Eutrema salsugineum]|uniref:Uncharacterized protein n=1 Tax=Eutrema salsugineum TaxID=72664 RepID=V4MC60_EUTSA|nr:uncharacterized protein At1g65710 [Eutrema salsugineum]ESQ28811.1 hypothetical protein EUTSA_v10018468mg [Eutrema salsugineum]
MGCCLSKKRSPSPPSNSLSNGTSCAVKTPDPKKPIKPVIELLENQSREEAKPIISDKFHQEEENVATKEVSVRKSHERSKKTDSEEEPPASMAAEKPIDSNSNSVVVRTSSCTKEEVDAILIQCGKLSRSNSAAKTRRYSGSKRSFDFDQNQRIRDFGGGDAEEEVTERKTPQRNRHRGVERVNGSPRERRRRSPSREREDSKSYRSGSRERGNGSGGGSRRVSRSPGKRSETTNPSGVSVNSNGIRPGKFVTVPATDKSNINGDSSTKRITVKRNIGEACRAAASPARTSANNVQAPLPPPTLSRSSSRKAEQSPYRRNPLGEIDQNLTKVDNCNKKMIKRENCNESANQKLARPPKAISRSRSLRKSRDFDFVPEPEEDKNTTSNYTALLLKDIKNFHGKSTEDPEVSFNLLPSCVTKACSIVEAVADLNASLSSDSSQFRFTSTVKKADLMEPSFEKYVTLKRGGSLEEQESCGSNNLT